MIIYFQLQTTKLKNNNLLLKDKDPNLVSLQILKLENVRMCTFNLQKALIQSINKY